MAEKTVIILTEGSKNAGFGHVSRCLALYQAFEEKGIYPLLIINGDESVTDIVESKDYKLFDWRKNLFLFSMIEKAEIIIIDSYLADESIYNQIAGKIKTPVFLDDYQRINYPEGTIINGAVLAENLPYIKNNRHFLLGSRFIPLRKAFWEFFPKTIKININRLMITFGGDDNTNMMPSMLKHLNNYFPHLIKKVIIGKGFSNIDLIKDQVKENAELILFPGSNKMREEMENADLAISAAGQTLYELAATGTPTIAVAVAENQRNNIQGWEKTGFIKNASDWNKEKTLDNIVECLKSLEDENMRKEKSEIGQRFVDGQGARRIINALIEINSKS